MSLLIVRQIRAMFYDVNNNKIGKYKFALGKVRYKMPS